MGTPTNRWRIAFFLALGVTLPLSGCLAYLLMDQAVSHTYMKDGYDGTVRDLDALATVFPKDRYKKRDLVSILRQHYPGALIVETACSVQLDGLRFDFDESHRMIGIVSRAEYTPSRKCGAAQD